LRPCSGQEASDPIANFQQQPPVLIVGGGIGGLAAALPLARQGCRVRVSEQAADFKEIGAGIRPGPNVLRMFSFALVPADPDQAGEQVGVLQQGAAGAGMDHRAAIQDDGVFGELEREPRVLLDQQQRQIVLALQPVET